MSLYKNLYKIIDTILINSKNVMERPHPSNFSLKVKSIVRYINQRFFLDVSKNYYLILIV